MSSQIIYRKMDNHQLLHIVTKHAVLRKYYVGTFPENMLPNPIKPGFMFVNTESWIGVMGHWVLIFYNSSKEVIFFDSFGKHPLEYGRNIGVFCDKFEKLKLCGRKQLQSNKSFTCGAYCVYVAMKLCQKQSIRNIMQRFNFKNLERNDFLVEQFVTRLMHDGKLAYSRDLCGVSTFYTKCQLKCKCSSS